MCKIMCNVSFIQKIVSDKGIIEITGILTGFDGTNIFVRCEKKKVELRASPKVKDVIASHIASPVKVTVEGKTALHIVKRHLEFS